MKQTTPYKIAIALLALAIAIPLAWAAGSTGIALRTGTGANDYSEWKGSSKGEATTASRSFTAPGAPVVVTLPTDGGYACVGPAGDGGASFCGNALAMSAGDAVRVSCNEATGDAYYLLGAGTLAGSAVTTSTGNILPDRAVERMILTGSQTSIGFATAATSGTPKCRVAVVGEVP